MATAEDETHTVGAPDPARRVPGLAEVALPPRFTPTRILGAGAMGFVVEARDQALDRDVAVKIIAASRLEDARTRNRFVREARAAATLRHDNIVTVYDLDPLGKYLVMELVRGETLRQRIAREGALAASEVRRIGRGLLSALAAAHAAGIVHRDVKPANILLGDELVKLADFGIAGTIDSELTRTGEVVGTPAYMAPEQLRGGGGGPRIDIYAAGATLFEMATGRRLHAARDRTLDPERAVMESVHDRGLAQAIARAVRDEPEARFADAREFGAALANDAAAPRPARRGRIMAGATIAAVTLAVAAHRTPEARWTAGSDGGDLEAGIAALAHQDFTVSERRLRAAAAGPDAARAHYYLAILYWWTFHATPQVLHELDEAARDGLDARLAAVADGIRALVTLSFPDAVTRLAALGVRYPDDRDVLYARFEALFHGGYPAEAVAVRNHLADVAPGFGLGWQHAAAYRLSHGQLGLARSVVALGAGIDRVRWEARIDAAGGEVTAAEHRLEHARADAGERDADALAWELVALRAVTGDASAAHALAIELGTHDAQSGAFPLLGLALARGTVERYDATEYLWSLAMRAASVPPTIVASTRDAWVDLATLIAIEGNTGRAQAALANLPGELDATMLEPAVARALLAGTIGDRETLVRAVTRSPFPEVRAVAEAQLAERAGDRSRAANRWRAALEADGFARFPIAISVRLARVLEAAGDHDGAIAACATALHPRLFHWSWGSAVGECLDITATAERSAGRIANSLAASRRLLALRGAAPASDRLVERARANLDLSADRTPP